MKFKLFLILVVLFFSMTQIFSQEISKRGTTAAPFLNISQGARATSMGSAFVAIADDPSTIYWNAAGLARLENNGVLFDHTQWIADVKYNFLAGVLNLGDFGTLGVSFITSDMDEMNVTTVDAPGGTGETFSVSDVAFSIAWAVNLTDNFSIGFNPKIISQTIWKMSATAFAVDMGVLYNTPFQGITLGMSITNFGTKMEMQGQNSIILVDLDEENGGNNDKIPSNLQMDAWDLPLGFKVGVSYTPIISDVHKVIMAVEASHPNDNYESVNLGGEYTYDNMFSIRGGYKSLFLDDSEESFSIGAGFRQNLVGNINIRFDYSYTDFGRLVDVQKFSLGINF
jgi:opacity protein-like surface antigen